MCACSSEVARGVKDIGLSVTVRVWVRVGTGNGYFFFFPLILK